MTGFKKKAHLDALSLLCFLDVGAMDYFIL